MNNEFNLLAEINAIREQCYGRNIKINPRVYIFLNRWYDEKTVSDLNSYVFGLELCDILSHDDIDRSIKYSILLLALKTKKYLSFSFENRRFDIFFKEEKGVSVKLYEDGEIVFQTKVHGMASSKQESEWFIPCTDYDAKMLLNTLSEIGKKIVTNHMGKVCLDICLGENKEALKSILKSLPSMQTDVLSGVFEFKNKTRYSYKIDSKGIKITWREGNEWLSATIHEDSNVVIKYSPDFRKVTLSKDDINITDTKLLFNIVRQIKYLMD